MFYTPILIVKAGLCEWTNYKLKNKELEKLPALRYALEPLVAS